MAWPDIVIIIGYFVIVLSLGVYFSRYMKSQKDFFLAGKKMPWWIAACSLQATDIGPETYIGVTGIVAASGLAACLHHPVYNFSVDFHEALSKKRCLYYPRVYGKKI